VHASVVLLANHTKASLVQSNLAAILVYKTSTVLLTLAYTQSRVLHTECGTVHMPEGKHGTADLQCLGTRTRAHIVQYTTTCMCFIVKLSNSSVQQHQIQHGSW
jgi:hypothetical protein